MKLTIIFKPDRRVILNYGNLIPTMLDFDGMAFLKIKKEKKNMESWNKKIIKLLERCT